MELHVRAAVMRKSFPCHGVIMDCMDPVSAAGTINGPFRRFIGLADMG